MGYQAIPGGYLDNQALADAVLANSRARDLMRRVLDERPGRGQLYQILAEMAHALGDASDALFAMREIRLKHKEAPGTQPGASPTRRQTGT